MSTYTERLPYTGSPEYDKHFWNAMRGRDSSFDELSKGYSRNAFFKRGALAVTICCSVSMSVLVKSSLGTEIVSLSSVSTASPT